jgi:putative acetyltransferase
MTVLIQPESWDDADGIRAVHLAAFPTTLEADLVKALHDDFDSEISLVARDDGQIVGHVLLSRMKVEGDGREYRALGLAPVAVLPERQRQGIGRELIDEALARAEKLGEELIFVLGEPEYYERFGFDPKTAAPFASPYAGAYFMARSFGASLPSSGTADYAPAFAKLG